ncbi:extracellular solute-binding protein [Actinotignum sanguinis]|uniref:extracellular solute-binding protein n=1 Tax=Actinotignum sanguinis TaxID=1445614 RepID=UPI00288BA60C|nr:extracellular solute-binding protein [Actinotignum sanguinis]
MYLSHWERQLARGGAALAVVAILAIIALMLRPVPELRILCSHNNVACTALSTEFSERTGIRVSLTRLPTGDAKKRVEASPNEFDVWLGGPSEAYEAASATGIFAPLEDIPAQIPERFRDPEGYWVGIYGSVLALCVREDAAHSPRTWKEATSPELRGKIVLPNPLTSGTAATMLSTIASVPSTAQGNEQNFLNTVRGLDRNTVTYTEYGAAPARVVAAGRADVGIAFAPYCEEAARRGAPVHTVYPGEGTGYEIGAVALLRHAPHAENGRAFIRFAMSEDGEKIGLNGVGQLATRTDIEENLARELAGLDVPVVTGNGFIQQRALVDTWVEEVRHGAL